MTIYVRSHAKLWNVYMVYKHSSNFIASYFVMWWNGLIGACLHISTDNVRSELECSKIIINTVRISKSLYGV